MYGTEAVAWPFDAFRNRAWCHRRAGIFVVIGVAASLAGPACSFPLIAGIVSAFSPSASFHLARFIPREGEAMSMPTNLSPFRWLHFGLDVAAIQHRHCSAVDLVSPAIWPSTYHCQ